MQIIGTGNTEQIYFIHTLGVPAAVIREKVGNSRLRLRVPAVVNAEIFAVFEFL